MNTTYITKQLGDFFKVTATFLVVSIYLGQESHAYGKRSLVDPDEDYEVFSLSDNTIPVYAGNHIVRCREKVREIREEVASILKDNRKLNQALFEVGEYVYNCTNVVVVLDSERFHLGKPRIRYADPGKIHYEVTAKVFCHPRTYSEKVLLAQSRACETDPSHSNCFNNDFIRRLDQLSPTRIVFDEQGVSCR